jgi:alpha-L-rhamnosidase
MIMWGTLDEFFFSDLAGIEGPSYYGKTVISPGYKNLVICPHILGELEFASASTKTVYGTVHTRWDKKPNGISLKLTVPVSCDAKVCLPKLRTGNVEVSENHKLVWKKNGFIPASEGVRSAVAEPNSIDFQIGSGSYEFKLENVNP